MKHYSKVIKILSIDVQLAVTKVGPQTSTLYKVVVMTRFWNNSNLDGKS